jgi:hypothetical protein
MLSDAHRAAIYALQRRLSAQPIAWAITASSGLALQGLPVTPADLDIQTDAAGAYAIAALFDHAITRPIRLSHTDRVQSHFGALTLGGLTVEIMGAVQYPRPDGSWDVPIDIVPHRRWIAFETLQVPVLTLEYELMAYRMLGRVPRIALLEATLGV